MPESTGVDDVANGRVPGQRPAPGARSQEEAVSDEGPLRRQKSAGPVVVHVPHSSATIPDGLRDQFALSDGELAGVHKAMVDHDTDLIAGDLAEVVRFGFSRLLVDVERFWDDDLEAMADIGMGAIYRVDHELRSIRRDLDHAENEVLHEMYDDHHSRLELAVDRALKAHDRCLIIDLHSYPAIGQPYERCDGPRPELCLGTDDFHTPEALASLAESVAAAHGFGACRNTPFAGTLVPMKHYRTDARVVSLMLEWRRDLYRHDGLSDPDAIQRLKAVVADVMASW